MHHHRTYLLPGFALFLLILGSCGDGGSGGAGPTARFVVAARGTAPFETDTEIERVCPRKLDFSVFLEEGGRGWVSLEHRAFGSRVFEVTWTNSDGAYHVIAPEVRVRGVFQQNPYHAAEVGWEDLRLEVEDEDGDGSAETGTASAVLICDWEIILSPETETFDSDFDLDGSTASVELRFVEGDGTEPMTPFDDDLLVAATGALLADSIPGGAELLVDGAPFPSNIEARDVQGPFAGGLSVDPLEPLPFDAELTLAPASIMDAFGAPVSFGVDRYHTVADPEPILVNMSFEQEGGWKGLATRNSSSQRTAVDGARYATFFFDLYGYFDVPLDATTLSVAVSFDDYYDGCRFAGASLSLHTSRGAEELMPEVPDDPDCQPFPEGCPIPWTRVIADLSEVRGERVMIHGIPARSSSCRFGYTETMYLDDFRIE